MSSEITLDTALQRVESSGVKDRVKPLQDLKHVLRNASKLDTLSDNAYHRIFEVLFAVAFTEKAIFLKAKTPTTRTAAENRLSGCASTLRTAVEVGVRHIKLKTVRAVLDHIFDTVVVSDGTFCAPLVLDYLKCLRSTLAYEPHVEHLTKDDREKIASFCTHCIRTAQPGIDDEGVSGTGTVATAGNTNGLSYRSSRSDARPTGGSQGSRALAKTIAEEIVACVSLLTSAPNAAPGQGASDYLSALIGVLQHGVLAGSSRTEAFAAINHVLAWTRTEDTGLTRKMTLPLVRLVRGHWGTKPQYDRALAAFRDEMVIALLYLRPFIFAELIGSEKTSSRSEVIGVADALRDEYCRRSEREQLRLEDVRLDLTDCVRPCPGEISTKVFRLRCANPRAEANWAIVYLLAGLTNAALDEPRGDAPSDDDEDEEFDHRPRKRRRTTDEVNELLVSTASGSITSRVCALQTLTFLVQQRSFGIAQLAMIMDKLTPICHEDNGLTVSWAMLALVSAALHSDSDHTSLAGRWQALWQLALKARSNVQTCRSACHLVRAIIQRSLVTQQDVVELVQLNSAADLNGPPMLADSVLSLMSYFTSASSQASLAPSNATAESIIGWLFRCFRPSKFAEREYASQQNLFDAEQIVGLLCSCLGQHIHTVDSHQIPTWTAVGQTWLECAAQQDLTSYLMLLPESSHNPHLNARTDRSVQPLSSSRPSCEAMVLSHLTSEMHEAHNTWVQLMREKLSGISSEVFATYCSSALITTCLAFCGSFRDSRQQLQLQRHVKDALRALSDFVSGQYCGREKTETMLAIFSSGYQGSVLLDSAAEHCECEQHICQTILRATTNRHRHSVSNGAPEMEDDMELDVAAASQDSRQNRSLAGENGMRCEKAIEFSNAALRANLIAYATAITAIHSRTDPGDEDGESSSGIMLDFLLSLTESEFILSQRVICSLSALGIELTVDDCYRLFDHCADRILGVYEYERNEVALVAILEIMTSFSTVLTDESNKALFDLGIDMHGWFTTVALRAGVLSPAVQERVASLLLRICHVDTDYGRDEERNVPSVRTSLFKLVELGSIRVKFGLASRISSIFGLFVLSNHSTMFDDLQTSLPEDTEWVEGMAIRLLFLARLASAWHSLLRQCIYYIFETAGRVASSSKHAAHSIRELASALEFTTPRKLFQIFAPQLLYTWLQRDPVQSLPYAIFDYDTLEALIVENQNELVAQLVVSGNDAGMQVAMNATKMTAKELVTRNFAKCEANCLGWDISHSASGSNDATCESRLRKLMGSKEEHKMFCNSHFAAIMGSLYLALQQDDPQDSWLEKRSGFAAATKSLTEMKSYSHSERTLPTTQDPSFKNKYLCDEVERLCRRTPFDPANPWEPSSFAMAARMLIDSIEDALGPLHTCSVIRKLRLLICMSGNVAFSGFPLQMLLHTLRPFLADSQCADDVIGVLQHLFHRGQTYLQTEPAFLFGTVMLIILQMRKHSEARLDSTTQESQHKSTVQMMQKFQTWLVQYLKTCRPPADTVDSRALSQIVDSMADVLNTINLPGNAKKGSAESALLIYLLAQDVADHPSLRDMDRKEALLLLSERFEIPTSVAEDCLGDDQECERLARPLFNVIHTPGLSNAFREWAANALGRAYASTGINLRNSTGKKRNLSAEASDLRDGVSHSQSVIADRLVEDLFSRDRAKASLADYTLRKVLTTFDEPEAITIFEQMLPEFVIVALSGGNHGHRPLYAADSVLTPPTLRQTLEPDPEGSLETWAQSVGLTLCKGAAGTAMLPALTVALQKSTTFALDFLPSIIHILLVNEDKRGQVLRSELSSGIGKLFANKDSALLSKQQYLVKLLLYLRKQPMPGEATHAERLRWLEVDWLAAAETAERCGMSTAALLFVESSVSPASGNRRSSSRASLTQTSLAQVPQELILSIFRNMDEPDSFYGVEQSPTLESVLSRLDYEMDGYKSLMFRSAQLDSHLRSHGQLSRADNAGMIRSLSMLNLNSLTFALLTSEANSRGSNDELLQTARQLQRWDIVPPAESIGPAATSFTAFQGLSRASDLKGLQFKLRSAMQKHIEPLLSPDHSKILPHSWFATLASLTEVNEILACTGQDALDARWKQMQNRQAWMARGTYDDYQLILSSRYTLFSVLSRKEALLTPMRIALKDCRSLEVKALLNVSRSARTHEQLQQALAASTQCTQLIEDSKDAIIRAEVAVSAETASVLWDMGEITASVNMLQKAYDLASVENQDIPVGRAGLLAQLAHQLAEARLEKPDDILSRYLQPAIDKLQSQSGGEEAGKVFYEFASFCDKQLQNPNNIEDFNRIAKLRNKKLEELQELQKLSRTAARSSNGIDEHSRSIDKAQQWYNIDDADYQRLKRGRDTFMEQSLQNYLLALGASNEHDISVLRFFTLWLETADVANASTIVNKHLPGVPSWKFVVLVNQLMSRLELEATPFQKILKTLVTRLCSEHPHHSLHQLFAATRPPHKEDAAAVSRYTVATEIRHRVKQKGKISELLDHVFKANNLYNALAAKAAGKTTGPKMAVRDIPDAHNMAKRIPTLHVPPATMKIPLRPDGDYSNVPVVTHFGANIQFMSGISRPKRLVAHASDGEVYVLLLKGPPGKDDLRQDAIMQQVFEEVSKMLQNHKATRQRNLHVRTYKVIPLSPNTGMIEFVPHSTSLSEFLLPAHERYYPQDYKSKTARERVDSVSKSSTEIRVKEFQKVCDHLHPVLRHFFFERFKDPAEWFERRTAYTRTTATISILGYVLGLGDRHCQNIMLDEKSGEVVHIDLGVAFEAGRVLPVPELVPFRLSRDIVDGMGITKTEGVFRRCCEFTMDALREDKDSIMTLLNVLRYDPLYTWTVSPLRAKRLQEATGRTAEDVHVDGSSRKKEQEAGEAERALSIVEKKLSKTLSTAAAVSELIQQATDVRNLATLYSGWAAYF